MTSRISTRASSTGPRALPFAPAGRSERPGRSRSGRAPPRRFGVLRLRPALRPCGELASIVAAIPAVRAALLDYQRRFAAHPAGAVLDGRDIGTVVCPEARVKLFVTASPEVRATRRHRELIAQGRTVDYAAVLDDILRRDERDAQRAVAPCGRPRARACSTPRIWI